MDNLSPISRRRPSGNETPCHPHARLLVGRWALSVREIDNQVGAVFLKEFSLEGGPKVGTATACHALKGSIAVYGADLNIALDHDD